MRRAVCAGLVALALCGCHGPATAQAPRRSQLGTVSQVIAGTRIDIVYRRPVARGRSLFGALVPWGRVWSPSSDSAARFTTTTAIDVNGARLDAGSYGVWAIPDSSSWTIIFNRESAAFHLRYPEGQDALRVQAAPERGEHVETLSFTFPMVDADSALLQLRWGTTVVPLRIHSKPDGG